jgi:hypothetical protein
MDLNKVALEFVMSMVVGFTAVSYSVVGYRDSLDTSSKAL